MTKIKFLADKGTICGFEISGHSSKNSDDEIGKIVCAAVSSAAYMAANTITEIIGDECLVEVDDARMYLKVKTPSLQSQKVLLGLRLHLSELSNQYDNNIRLHGGAEDVKD